MEITREDVIRFIEKASDEMNENKDYLIELDANSGDGDLGLTMSKGFNAAKEKALSSEETDLGKLFFAIGSAIAAAVPSTMGTLMGSGMLGAAKVLKGKESLDAAGFAAFAKGYYDGVQKRGKQRIWLLSMARRLYTERNSTAYRTRVRSWEACCIRHGSKRSEGVITYVDERIIWC